ncbi:hypothetical protein Pelo_4617 [Pelomyxa schiedti]|nr:hypothetical protein Pelo_4617 [Pelomyxa schiedti]
MMTHQQQTQTAARCSSPRPPRSPLPPPPVLLHGGGGSATRPTTIDCFVVGESSSDTYLLDLLHKYNSNKTGGEMAKVSQTSLDGEEASSSSAAAAAAVVLTDLTITSRIYMKSDGDCNCDCDCSCFSAGPAGRGGDIDVVFHRKGSEEMRPECVQKEGSVVLAMMPFGDHQYKEENEVTKKAYMSDLLLDSCGSRPLSGDGSLILVNFGEKQPVFTHMVPKGSNPLDYTMLGIAIGMRAGHLFKSNREPDKETIKNLIHAIVHTSQTSYRNGQGSFHKKKCRRTCLSSCFLEALSFPKEGLIGVTKMSCLHLRPLVRLVLSSYNLKSATVFESLLPLWFQAENWPAVDELVLSNFFLESELQVPLHSRFVPQLEGIHCRGVVLHSKEVQSHGIPEWLLRPRVGGMRFHPEQPTYLPKSSNSPDWSFLKLFLSFGDEVITEEAPNRIVFVMLGGPSPEKVALLKCLMENKVKATVKISTTKAPPVIQVHKAFKLWNTSKPPLSDLCSAWEIGGGDTENEWNPFNPCFFFSDSVFMLAFDPSSQTQISNLDFWINEISSRHRNKMNPLCYRPHSHKPQVLLVGTRTKYFDGKLFRTIKSRWESRINILGYFILDPETGFGISWHPHNLTPSKHKSIIPSIAGAIQSTHKAKYNIPQTWARFRAHLGTVKASAVKWSQLARIAHDCGVGRCARKVSQAAEEEEMRLCFDWLSDIGALFHLRHNAASQRMEDDIVALDPSWFNDTNKLLPVEIHLIPSDASESPLESLQRYTIKHLHDHHIGTDMTSVLLQVGVLVNSINNQPHFSFSKLPSVSSHSSLVDKFCKLCGDDTNASGCLLCLKLLPIESFSKVMCHLSKMPGVHPIQIRRDGILVSKTQYQRGDTGPVAVDGAGETHLMMIRTVDPRHEQNTLVLVLPVTILAYE